MSKNSIPRKEFTEEEKKAYFEAKNNAVKVLNEQTNNYLDELTKNVDKQETKDQIIANLEQFAKHYNYSYRNVLLASFQAAHRGIEINLLKSADEWKNIKDGDSQVLINKGEKGIDILVPSQVTKYEYDSETGYKLDTRGEKIPVFKSDGVTQETRTVFRIGKVFDVEQTNAYSIGALERADDSKIEITPDVINELARKIQNEYNTKVAFETSSADSYAKEKNTITINNAITPEQQLSRLFCKLGNKVLSEFRSESKVQEIKEAAAEAFSYVLSKKFGVDNKNELYSHNFWSSINGNRENLKALFEDVSSNVSYAIKKLDLNSMITNFAQQQNPVFEQETSKIEPNKTQERIYLDVPFNNKNDAMNKGAKWDKEKKQWFIQSNQDLNNFKDYFIDEMTGISAAREKDNDRSKNKKESSETTATNTNKTKNFQKRY